MPSLSVEESEKNVAEFVETSSASNGDQAREEAKLVRKIDLYLLPTIWLMYLLSYMDVCLDLSSLESIVLTTYREQTLAMRG